MTKEIILSRSSANNLYEEDRDCVSKRTANLRLHRTERGEWLKAAQLFMVTALAFLCADLALIRFAFSDGWTILWPLNGVTIALLLMRKRHEWPVILLGVGVGTGVGQCLNSYPIGFEIVQRLISCSEVFICAWVLPSFDSFSNWLRRNRNQKFQPNFSNPKRQTTSAPRR